MKYAIRCYNRSGRFDHEEIFNSLAEAERRRKEWGLGIGLAPEPSPDFAFYPTIWEISDNGRRRLPGY